MKKPKKPTAKVIKSQLQTWRALENYRLQEQSLALLFHQFCPHNTNLERILLKVTALNQFYSTRIYDTYSVAKHILKMNIDGRLASHDLALVNELALVKIGQKQRNCYSFASKYCSHHLPDVFPIYDGFVDRMLWHYRSVDSFAVFKRKNLKTYADFVRVINSFQKHYGLERFGLRELDVFLWIEGKRCFPKDYSPK
jgi:hypothetical protein